jgi:hypothetical protein
MKLFWKEVIYMERSPIAIAITDAMLHVAEQILPYVIVVIIVWFVLSRIEKHLDN